MIVFGTRLFGWVDGIEGEGMVATRFFHVMFVPLVPMGSVFMVDDDRGVQLPLSVKSVIVAWVRSGLFWSAVAMWALVPASFGISCVVALPLTLAWAVLPLLVRTASARRAEAIHAQLRG